MTEVAGRGTLGARAHPVISAKLMWGSGVRVSFTWLPCVSVCLGNLISSVGCCRQVTNRSRFSLHSMLLLNY